MGACLIGASQGYPGRPATTLRCGLAWNSAVHIAEDSRVCIYEPWLSCAWPGAVLCSSSL